MPPPVNYSVDAEKVGWIIFDDATARANLLNAVTLDALAQAISAAERDDLRGLVVVSAKEKIFIAGADLKVIAALPDAETATRYSREGQRLFQRLAEMRCPVICAIHGACAGGGCELALACHWRMASDGTST